MGLAELKSEKKRKQFEGESLFLLVTKEKERERGNVGESTPTYHCAAWILPHTQLSISIPTPCIRILYV